MIAEFALEMEVPASTLAKVTVAMPALEAPNSVVGAQQPALVNLSLHLPALKNSKLHAQFQ